MSTVNRLDSASGLLIEIRWRRAGDVPLATTEQELAGVTADPCPGWHDADAALFAAELRLKPALVAAEAAGAADREAQGRM